MKPFRKKCFVVLMLVATQPTWAHKRWLLPSLFNVSEPQWITIDATVSNNIFFADRPWPLARIRVETPTGKEAKIENKVEGHRRSSFDVELKETGTHKVVSGGEVFFAQFQESGADKPSRKRGFDFEELKSSIPNDATAVKYAKSISRLESYITFGAPSLQVFEPKNKGIELVPVTHPNDLYQSEKVQFKFLVNGEAVKGLEALVVWEGTRHRNAEEAVTYQTDEAGILTIALTQSGRFLIEINHEAEAKNDPVFEKYYFGYFGTFEVLPQ